VRIGAVTGQLPDLDVAGADKTSTLYTKYNYFLLSSLRAYPIYQLTCQYPEMQSPEWLVANIDLPWIQQ